MARGINKAIIVGCLGQDPELRTTQTHTTMTTVSVATSESWKDKQTGQQQERTEWHRIVFFNRLAEIAAQYLKKGSKVYVEGSIRTRKWQDKSGVDRYTNEIIASELQMLDSKNDGPVNSGYQKNYPQQQMAINQPIKTQNHPLPAPGEFDDFNDDIPF